MTSSTAPDALQKARRFLLKEGRVPEGVLDDWLARAWQRSLDAGLSCRDDLQALPPQADTATFRTVMQTHGGPLHAVRPTLEWLGQQLPGSGHLLVATDAQGMILDTFGDPAMQAHSERVGLRPGSQWSETHRGCNGIGTALVMGQWCEVTGSQHYLERNAFLRTQCVPLRGSDGRITAAVGLISEAAAGTGSLAPGRPFLTLAATLLEDRLFHHRHKRDQLLHIHLHAEGLGLPGEGLLAISDDGWVMGANAMARDWLAIPTEHIGATTVDRLLGMGAHLSVRSTPSRWTTSQGRSYFLRDDPDRRPKTWSPATADDFRGYSRPALPALRDSEDPRVSLALRKAWRVQDLGIPLLLLGESGSGKEAFARSLHREGPRARSPFVVMNCSAVSPHALESALFGHVSADINGGIVPGALQQAEGGILFLHEVADLPLSLQGKLLNALREQTVVPVDGHQSQHVDVVLVCATRRHLPELVAKGQFREDLYYQLNGLAITLPPLRERSDFHLIAEDMLRSLAREMRLPEAPVLSEHLSRVLPALRWPGNLRQLRNALRTACALLPADEQVIRAEHLPDDVQEALKQKDGGHLRLAHDPWPAAAVAGNEPVSLRQLSDAVIEQTIRACDGNMSEAARRLGISRNTLYRRMKGAA